MLALQVNLDGEGAWSDLAAREVVTGAWTRLTALPAGTVRGKLSIGIAVELPDGKVVFAETSWALLHAACRGIEARYGPPA